MADLPEMVKPAGTLLAKQLKQQKVQLPDIFSHLQAGFAGCAEMHSALGYPDTSAQVKPT